MNALVGIRSNATGLLSPTPEQRDNVAQSLRQTAAARAGMRAASETTSTSSAASVASATATRDPAQNELGKDAFLELLVLQLRNQDPLEPVDNSQMLSQLAQFSALEAQTNLNENFQILSSNVDQLNFISASQLLGRVVTGVDLNGEVRTGVVESVHLDGSLVVLSVDGEFMSMAGLIGIEPDGGTDTEVDDQETEGEEEETESTT